MMIRQILEAIAEKELHPKQYMFPATTTAEVEHLLATNGWVKDESDPEVPEDTTVWRHPAFPEHAHAGISVTVEDDGSLTNVFYHDVGGSSEVWPTLNEIAKVMGELEDKYGVVK